MNERKSEQAGHGDRRGVDCRGEPAQRSREPVAPQATAGRHAAALRSGAKQSHERANVRALEQPGTKLDRFRAARDDDDQTLPTVPPKGAVGN